MSPIPYTKNEEKLLDYFKMIDQKGINQILSNYSSTGPRGYSTSLVLARILKVKERISSDRELVDKLAKNPVYRRATGLSANNIPAHNTFNTLRNRLGPKGYIDIHKNIVLQAYELGLLNPKIESLPKPVKNGAIIIADSTFMKTAGSTSGERDNNGKWFFKDSTAAFGKPHHKHKYPVGHRTHSCMSLNGLPLISQVEPANESDQNHILPLLENLCSRYPAIKFVCIILDAGYDSEDIYQMVFYDLKILPVIIRKKMVYPKAYSEFGAPLCPFGYPTRRKGIEYKNKRTKFACFKKCKADPQRKLFSCEHENKPSKFGYLTYTYFSDSLRKFGPAVPGSRIYETLKPYRTGIERFYGLIKENRYRMEQHNTYIEANNVLMHVIEHDIVLTLDIIYEYQRFGKTSPVLSQ